LYPDDTGDGFVFAAFDASRRLTRPRSAEFSFSNLVFFFSNASMRASTLSADVSARDETETAHAADATHENISALIDLFMNRSPCMIDSSSKGPTQKKKTNRQITLDANQQLIPLRSGHRRSGQQIQELERDCLGICLFACMFSADRGNARNGGEDCRKRRPTL
jgi:hypothetical protein